MPTLSAWLLLLTLRPCLRNRAGRLCDGAMLALGLPALYQQGLPAPTLPGWLWWPTYPAVASLTFVLSVCMTTAQPLRYLRAMARACAASTPGQHGILLLRSVLVAGYEELIWRCLAQTALTAALGAPLAVPLVALSFTVWHRHQLGSARQAVELACFALLLGALFALTADPLLVIALHALRNYFIYIGSGHHEKH